jgi:hypothetical protein
LNNSLSGKYGKDVKKQVLCEWLESIGNNDHLHRHQKFSDKMMDLYKNIEEASDAKLARARVREYNIQSAEITLFAHNNGSFVKSLKDEFAVFKTFFDSRDNFPQCRKPAAYIRYCIALFFAAIGLPAFVLFIPVSLCFLFYSWFYPVVELVMALVHNNADLVSIAALPLCLTLAYLFTIVLMLSLAHNIYKFNRLCTDIVPLFGAGLPQCFFDVAVVDRISVVYNSELCWQHLDLFFDDIFGMDVTLLIKSYYSSGHPNLEGLYGSRNLMILMTPVTLRINNENNANNRSQLQLTEV